MNFIVKRLQLGVQFYTNAYIIISKDTNNCVVIDPAYNNGELTKFILENNLNVIGVMLTHSHPDHCGGVAETVGDKKIPVYCSEIDAPFTQNAHENHWHIRSENCIVTDFVTGGVPLTIGEFTFDVIATPGHTKGSVCYIIGDFLFSGDTLFAGSIGRTDLPGGSMKDMRESLKKLSKLEQNYFICPGHEETTRLLYEIESNPYLQNL